MEESTTYQHILHKGAINIARRMVRAAGQKKFGPIPAELEPALLAIDDTGRMERIIAQVTVADDWDDLLNTL